ncbi:MAG TPA: hypothetical protein PKA41_09635 [Verrucomicrobiota bacterium]|nr:hypothetical protein [Verrucomicrobiota bacterium]
MFGLDPQNLAARVKASGQAVRLPSVTESVLRGMVGFTLVSLGGFGPWVLAGRWFYRNVGELGLYVVCAVVFVGLSGLLMHRLIIGPGSLSRFYKVFSVAFVAYAVAWTVGWMSFRGVTGSVVGALAGMAVMGGVLAVGFAARDAVWKIIIVLFVANAAGYFIGEWAYKGVLSLKEGNASGIVLEQSTRAALSKLAWGLIYGLGSGAGIGWAFYVCQTKARQLIRAGTPNPSV